MPTYGLSEMGSGVTALPSAEAAHAPGTAGRPLPGMTVRIDDPGPDGVGEIVVGGPSRSSGYLGEAPVPAAEPVRTGDLGKLDSAGRLVVVDRRTDRIVRGGENIDPTEVETVLERHPAVAEAAVVGRPDDAWGHVPVAAIVLRPHSTDPGDEMLAAHARASLAGFKVPAAWTRFDVLPRTSSGKLRRDVVRSLVAGDASGELARPGGDAIGWRVDGMGPRHVLLLHGTLSTSQQLAKLAAQLVARADLTVHSIDRRGAGTSRLAEPRPLDVDLHLDDLVAYLDARGIANGERRRDLVRRRARAGGGGTAAGAHRQRRRVRAALRACRRSRAASRGSAASHATRSGRSMPGAARPRPRPSCGTWPATTRGTACRPGRGRSSSGRGRARSPTRR